MKPLLQAATKQWHPKPVQPPIVDSEFIKMNGLQRTTESLRYILLHWEHWVSPSGDMREWLRRNFYVGAWLLIPALFVMPVVGLILWQMSGWMAMLASITGGLIVLAVLVLLAFIVIKIVVALLKH